VKRRLFDFAAAASLMLCVATLASWVRSYYRYDAVGYESVNATGRAKTGVELLSWDGFVLYVHEAQQANQSRDARGRTDFHVSSGPVEEFGPVLLTSPQGHHWHGFGYVYDPHGRLNIDPRQSTLRRFHVMSPHWALALVFAVLPVHFAFLQRRRRLRCSSNQCVHCGYDLRATPECCPECGMPAKPQAAEGAAA
jgi:hypothetical protein